MKASARREPWIALDLSERVAALAELVPETWGELEHFGLIPKGRGRSLLFQCSRPVLESILDRCRKLDAWRRDGALVLPDGDRLQVRRAIARIQSALDRHYLTQDAAP